MFVHVPNPVRGLPTGGVPVLIWFDLIYLKYWTINQRFGTRRFYLLSRIFHAFLVTWDGLHVHHGELIRIGHQHNLTGNITTHKIGKVKVPTGKAHMPWVAIVAHAANTFKKEMQRQRAYDSHTSPHNQSTWSTPTVPVIYVSRYIPFCMSFNPRRSTNQSKFD